MADENQEYVALCAGCATERGADRGEAELIDDPEFDGACFHCGAILSGFFYRAPIGADSGMAPGAG